MDVEFRSFDAGALLARDVKVILIEPQFLQFVFELMEIDAQIEQHADEHIAADPAKNIQIDRLHLSSPAAEALIWLAA